MTGRMPPEGINPVEPPDILYDVWQWFLSLHQARPSGLAMSPISEEAIGWFFRNRHITPEGWQIEIIRALDSVAFESQG